MGHYEDFFWEITEELKQLGLKEEFEKEVRKLQSNDEFKYKSIKERWEYALNKVKQLHKINK
tara:strand:+ start:1214 stop:1399 length:186 start_codon:yes stop_codon:yes gene_type:complete